MALPSTFNLGADCPRFQRYVNDLRSQVRDPNLSPQQAQLFDGVYLLRPYTTVPVQWLHIRIVDGADVIVAIIRTDNFYLIGFRQERAGGRTWEFGRRVTHQLGQRWGREQLIDNSEPLGFDGGYNNGGVGELHVAPTPEPGQPQPPPPIDPDLGFQPLRNAIQGLARYEPRAGGQHVGRWLRTVIVSFIESFRSPVICAFVGNRLYEKGPTADLQKEHICIIRNWNKISACVIRMANDPDNHELADVLVGEGICSNRYEVRLKVAMLYRGPADRDRPRPRRSTSTAAIIDDIPPGLTLVQVFAVVILDIDDREILGDLYGTIAVDDGLGPEVLLFRRGRSESQSVGAPGGLAELTSPNRAIWGYDEIFFDLDLSHGSGIPDMSPDRQISKGQMVWNTNERPVEDYNIAQDYVFKGKYGSVKLLYAVITNSVVARVVVDLSLSHVNGGSDTAVLYGSITAATSGFPDKIKLFNTDWNHPVATPAGRSITLLWNVVVVQLGASLNVNADIWNRGLLPDMSPPDHQIAKGEAEFGAALAGTVSKAIPGPSGEVKVHVTWSRV